MLRAVLVKQSPFLLRNLVSPLVASARPIGGWDPRSPSTATLAAWFDPSCIATLFTDTAGTVPVTADGDLVACMKDKSGNNNHATQATSGARPIYRSGGYLDFDGARFMVTGSIQLTDGSGRHSAAAAAYFNAVASYQNVLDADNGTSVRVSQFLRCNPSGQLETIAFNTTPGAFTDTGPSISAATGTVLSEITTATTTEAFVNGVGSGGSTATSGSPAAVASVLTIGAFASGNSQFLTGRFYGSANYQGALSANDHAQLVAYLTAKIPAGTAYSQAISVSSTPTPVLRLSTGKLLSISSTPTPTLVRSVGKPLAVGSTPASSLIRRTAKALVISSAPVPALLKAFAKALSISTTPAPTQLRSTGKPIAVAATPTPLIVRNTTHRLPIALTPVPGVTRQTAKRATISSTPTPTFNALRAVGVNLTILTTPAPSARRVIGKAANVNSTPPPSLVKSLARMLSITEIPVPAVVRSTSRTSSVTATPSPAAAVTRLYARMLVVSATPGPSLTRTVAKVLTVATGPVGSLVRGVGRLLSISAAPVPAVAEQLHHQVEHPPVTTPADRRAAGELAPRDAAGTAQPRLATGSAPDRAAAGSLEDRTAAPNLQPRRSAA